MDPETQRQTRIFRSCQPARSTPLIVHEGVPGHYMQLWLSWHNPDPIRRHYYDSGANEGLGFYAEEMMLLAGLFDDSPHTREIIYNFMRLRALRVEVDVKLALGQLNNEEAAAYLAKDRAHESKDRAEPKRAMFATQPGQGISYPGRQDANHEISGRRARSGRRQSSTSTRSTISSGATAMFPSSSSAPNGSASPRS